MLKKVPENIDTSETIAMPSLLLNSDVIFVNRNTLISTSIIFAGDLQGFSQGEVFPSKGGGSVFNT